MENIAILKQELHTLRNTLHATTLENIDLKIQFAGLQVRNDKPYY